MKWLISSAAALFCGGLLGTGTIHVSELNLDANVSGSSDLEFNFDHLTGTFGAGRGGAPASGLDGIMEVFDTGFFPPEEADAG